MPVGRPRRPRRRAPPTTRCGRGLIDAPLVALPDSTGALARHGWDDRLRALWSDLPGSDALRPARVTRVERTEVDVAGAGGYARAVIGDRRLAVGDWVALSDDGEVRAVLGRTTTLTRADPSGTGVQVLAANIDLVLITAPADRLSPARVERELLVASASGARPVVVVTKVDAAGTGEHPVRKLERRIAGAEVIGASARTGEGLATVRDLLRPHRSGVLLGPSGAGKSTLTNALLGEEAQRTGAVREGDRRGRHTTSTRQLLLVPGGGVLIDTPGIRSIGLSGATSLDEVFPEVEALAEACRFSDCSHTVEPGCAVRAAVASGGLDGRRLASYLKLASEAAARDRSLEDARHRSR